MLFHLFPATWTTRRNDLDIVEDLPLGKRGDLQLAAHFGDASAEGRRVDPEGSSGGEAGAGRWGWDGGWSGRWGMEVWGSEHGLGGEILVNLKDDAISDLLR